MEEEAKKEAEGKTEGEEEKVKVHEEIARILNRSPITVFSKTYCHYSKRAKKLLLSEYRIEPAPYVVELDEHELGPEIQKWLGEFTGRTTVPNILINSKSIGGADDILELDRSNTLASTIKGLGGNQVSEIERVHEVQDGDVE
ncbi:glutaredoxin [Ascobolus immersus RN42]|uniref:Glutaredoxin n=1 Tax=Ascobolus immersus RN42 TaxID=1160509 RepID=A0A3N4IJ42_ASCIM|nr:glutaredoxin [Ascobolus immersus RN42]